MADDPFAAYAVKDDQFAAFVTKDAAPRADVHPVSPNEPGTKFGGWMKSLKDQFSEAVNHATTTDENGMLAPTVVSPGVKRFMATPLAHPTGIDAVDGFTSPAAIGMMAAGGAAHAIGDTPITRSSVGRAMRFVGDNTDLMKPLKMVGKVGEVLERSGANRTDVPIDRYMPNSGGMPTGATATARERIPYATQTEAAPTPGEPAPAATGSLSAIDKATIARKYPGLSFEKVEAALAQQQPPKTPPGMIRGSLKPITVAPESPMQPPADNPLQQPRIDVGAEVVGRQNGLTKEAVRQQTGPLFTEAPGAASPVVPQTPFDRMHDKLKAMGPGNPEREAYVQAAGDPKTAGQLEIMRRTLERNGLSVAAATSMAEAIRRQVMARLSGQRSSQ